MRNVIKEMLQAFDAKLYYPALFTAVSVPDICAALDTNGHATPEKYIKWFDIYASKYFQTLLDGERAYFVRCAVLHQGRLHHKKIKSGFDEIMIVTENKTGIGIDLIGINHGNRREYLVIELRNLCQSIYMAAIEWLNEVEQTQIYQANYRQFFKKNKQPLPWDEEGVSVLASFQ